MNKFSKSVNEGSTFVATLNFLDETGLSVKPVTTTWELYDSDGAVVNNRNSVSVTPAAVLDIVIFGNDLVVPADKPFEKMTLIVRATYNSSRGTGLPLTESLVFQVNKLRP